MVYLGASWTVSPERGGGGVAVGAAAGEEGVVIRMDGVRDAVTIAAAAVAAVLVMVGRRG